MMKPVMPSSSPSGRLPGRPRSEASRAAALNAALELLEEIGYARLSIDGIAARAGISKPTIYRWWTGKGAVVIEAFLADTSPLIAFPHTASAIADVKAQLRSVAMAYKGKAGRIIRDLIALGQDDPEALDMFISGYIEPRRRLAKEALQRCVDQGSIRPDINFDDAVDSLYSPIFFRLLVRHLPMDEDSIERHVDLILSGISPEK